MLGGILAGMTLAVVLLMPVTTFAWAFGVS